MRSSLRSTVPGKLWWSLDIPRRAHLRGSLPIVAHERVAQVVLIGGFPSSNGEAYSDFFEHVDDAMPFPGWEPFDGPDSADLDDETKAMFAARAVPVPSAVARGVVRLDDEQRRRVPVTVVCPEFTAEQAQGWIAGGDVAELAEAADVRMVDIDSGHWPMFTRPVELARLLHEATT